MAEVEAFEAERGRLFGLAYRMLGSVASAEDVVQETYLRFANRPEVITPGAWLRQVTTRLCLDELKSARVRRESYVGPWLPEPLMDDAPVDRVELAQSVRMAVMLLMEQLPATHRAAYLLREVFEQGYDEISAALEVSEATCRQWVARAKKHLDGAPRFEVDAGAQLALVAQFGVAAQTGDVEGLEKLLAEQVVAMSDGAGKVKGAGLRPVLGVSKVARLYTSLARKFGGELQVEPVWANGSPGVLLRREGVVYGVTLFDVVDGKIVAIRSVLNPEKLLHLA